MRSLHPVREHDNEIDGNVLPAEGIELRMELLGGSLGPRGSALCNLQVLFILRCVQEVGTDESYGEDSPHYH